MRIVLNHKVATLPLIAALIGLSSAGIARAEGMSPDGVLSGRSASIPADFVSLVDDTGALSVSVPASWVDVDTAPGTNDDGTPMPWISASPDFAAYRETFDVPGMAYIGVTYTDDLQSWIDKLGQAGACATAVTDPYDDGAFQGLLATYGGCGPAQQATFVVLAANVADDQTRTYVLQIQAATPADAASIDPILGSFNAVGITSTVGTDGAPTSASPASIPAVAPPEAVTTADGSQLMPATATDPATPEVPTTALTPGAPTSTVGVFTPPVEFPDDTVAVVDDTGLLVVGVPPSWTEVITAPRADAQGSEQPYIAASPDLDMFLYDPQSGNDPFSTPGVIYIGLPFTADTTAVLAQIADGQACTPGPVQGYADSEFSGHIQEFTGCGGTQTRLFVLVANPASNTFTAALTVQVTDDPSVLDTVLATFNFDSNAPAPVG